MRARERLALRTVDLARAAGAHPNTVRLYAERGYLPPVMRSPTGYRLFEPRHLDHMRLARLLLRDRWPGRAIRRSAMAVLADAAASGLARSTERFAAHLALVLGERAVAGQACEIARDWLARGREATGAREATEAGGATLRSGEVVDRLGLTHGVLRSWERSGLIRTPRDASTGWRRFGPVELDRLVVIGALRRAGYSPMAVLRMLAAADRGQPMRAIGALVDPDGDEDLVTASDRWAATLDEHVRCAAEAVELVAAIVGNSANPPLAHQGLSVGGD